MENENQFEYAGFWVRLGAAVIDSILFLIVTTPLLYWAYGSYYFESNEFIYGAWDLLLNWILPFVGTILFWIYRSATPGKIALKMRVVDANTGEPISVNKSIIRYFAYFVSAIPLCFGFIWIAFSSKKQGWHDMLANTVVTRPKDRGVEAVEFEKNTQP